jgi:hypothetical protein
MTVVLRPVTEVCTSYAESKGSVDNFRTRIREGAAGTCQHQKRGHRPYVVWTHVSGNAKVLQLMEHSSTGQRVPSKVSSTTRGTVRGSV